MHILEHYALSTQNDKFSDRKLSHYICIYFLIKVSLWANIVKYNELKLGRVDLWEETNVKMDHNAHRNALLDV